MSTLGIALIGAGHIALANHLPGFALCPDARVRVICNADPAMCEQARLATAAAGQAPCRFPCLENPADPSAYAATSCLNDCHEPIP